MEGPGRQVFSVIRADRGKAGYRVAWEKRQKEERLACTTVSLLHLLLNLLFCVRFRAQALGGQW